MNIQAMKYQTFGVEVEMVLDRKVAADAIAAYFGTEARYTGGGVDYPRYAVKDNMGRTWKVVYDSSIWGATGMRCEVVTPILDYNDIETLQEVMRVLRRAGGISHPSKCCGVHIHVGTDGHDTQSLTNLSNIMVSHEDLLIAALRLDEERVDNYCHKTSEEFIRTLSTEKPKTIAEFREIWYSSHHSYSEIERASHYNNSRYHMLNLHSVWYHGTVEFRFFQFDEPTAERKNGIHAGQLKAYIQFCLAISHYAKTHKFCKSKIKMNNNWRTSTIITMRNWLNSLGLTGDEFKTCRYFFTKNLTNVNHNYIECAS